MGSKDLKAAIRRLVGPKRRRVEDVSHLPFEALMQQRMEGLEKQLDELKGRAYGLLLTIVGTVVADLVIRLAR